MTDKQAPAPTALEEVVAAPPPIEPIYKMGHMPMFALPAGKDPDTFIEAIAAQGFSMFYLLANEKIKETTENTHSTVTNVTLVPRILKVTKNLVGRSVVPLRDVKPGQIPLGTVEPQAFFMLPFVPVELLNKIDDFFRLVHDRHHTEAVVLFTFDQSFLAHANYEDRVKGWGIIVPPQKNSAASCNYDMAKAWEDLPEHLDIVGSAHSHPNMSAYCSPTDTHDQLGFDGLHITYAWKNGSNHTEFHAEMQLGDRHFNYNLPDITYYPARERDASVEEYMGQVTKEVFTHQTSTSGTQYGGTQASKITPPVKNKFPGLPDDCPTPDKVALICQTNLDAKEISFCPTCRVALVATTETFQKRLQCNTCQTFILFKGMTPEDLIAVRKENSHPTMSLEPLTDPTKMGFKSIWLREITKEVVADDKTNENRVEYHEYIDYLHLIAADKMKRDEADKEGGGSGKVSGGYSATYSDGIVTCPSCGEEGDLEHMLLYKEVHGDDGDQMLCMYCLSPIESITFPTPDDEDDDDFGPPMAGVEVRPGLTYRDFNQIRPHPWWDEDQTFICACGVLYDPESQCACGESEIFPFALIDDWVLGDEHLGVYDPSSMNACFDCKFAYTPACPGYVEFLSLYANAPMFEGDSDFVTDCDQFRPFTEEDEY